MSGSVSSGLTTNPAVTVGSGSDTILLQMSGDSYGPAGAPGADAEFTVNVDGQQIGGLQSVSASHADGQEETFAFLGNFAPGPHTVTVTFANNDGTQGDKTDFGRGGDRNVFVDGVSYNGQTISSTTTPIYESPLFPPNGPLTPGNAVFTVNDTTAVPADAASTPSTTPGPVDFGSGADTLSLQMSEDPYQGDAQFTVSVDGKQVGGTFTTTAIAWQGQEQTFNLHGDWGSGAHTVTVNYLSDQIGAVDGGGNAIDNTDQNLFVKGISYDGVQGSGAPWELASNGPHDFSIPSGGQPGGGASTSTSSTGTSSTDTTTAGAAADDISAKDASAAGTSTTDTASNATTAGTAADGTSSKDASATGTAVTGASATDSSSNATTAGTSPDDTSSKDAPATGTTVTDTSAADPSAAGTPATTTGDETAPINASTIGSGQQAGSGDSSDSGMSFISSGDKGSSTNDASGSSASDPAASGTDTSGAATSWQSICQNMMNGAKDWWTPTQNAAADTTAGSYGGGYNWWNAQDPSDYAGIATQHQAAA